MGFAERLTAVLDRTEAFVLAREYRGWDPYDGLMAPYWSWPGLRSARRLRWAWQQVVKRSLVNPRPLLGIRPGCNPVTLGLCLQAYSWRDAAAGQDRRAARAAGLVGTLADMASPGWSGPCWGYDFFWEGRFASTPPFHPTVVATGFIVSALYDAHRRWGLESAADLVRGAAEFVVTDLNRTDYPDGFCWSYSPTDSQSIVNASLKGARICAQAYALGGASALRDEAVGAARFVVSRRRPDGTWPYSLSDDREWVDNFHTGYVLDCLDDVARLTGTEEFRPAIDHGLEYYLTNFFAEGRIPRYYHQQTYPVDATACAQSILTLVRFGHLEQARRVAEWCIDRFALPDGSYKYQLHRRFENRQVFMRWSVAWMFAALARLELALAST